MKYISLLIYLSFSFNSFSQQSYKFRAPSKWIGEIEIGQKKPKLIFDFYTDSTNLVKCNLKIPSKGSNIIPFSNIQINNDSILLEIAFAQVSYKGVFISTSQTLEGIWKEGSNEYPLKLTHLTYVFDYDKFKKENPPSLNQELTSENFNFYAKKEDVNILDTLATILESNYARITGHMCTEFNTRIDVYIYPDLDAFHEAIYYPDAPDWVVGAAGVNEIKMVSPQNPGRVHNYESLMQAITHEFTHSVVLNMRKNALEGLPNWLNEGYAYFEAKQLTKKMREFIATKIIDGSVATWTQIEQANTSEFGEMYGYEISATIIEFLVNVYGYNKLRQFILEPEKSEEIFFVSKSNLELLWLDYIRKQAEKQKGSVTIDLK